MWAWRSLLSRPRLLRPARRHAIANRMAAALGRNGLMGSRGYASDDSSGDPAGAEVATTTKRHLYVVLDNCRSGYGIHKLDMDDDDLDGAGRARSLPEPPVLRVALPSVTDSTRFAAVGSSIVAISPMGMCDSGGVLIYDTKSAAQVVTRWPYLQCLRGFEGAMAVGGRLYMFGDTLCCLTEERCGGYWEWDWEWERHRIDSHPDPEEWDCSESRVQLLDPMSHGQAAQHVPVRTEWSCWESYVRLPFSARYITALAVHAPPGQAAAKHDLFVSVSTVRTRCATYSFSTATAKWTRRGTWQLPVTGHAHYDGELGAWLGLNAAEGHLWAGDITSAPATWKVGREKLLGERVAAAKLVPMAPSEYCLVEQINDLQFDSYDSELRLTTFRVGRGQDGAPVVTSRRPARSYKFSKYNYNSNFAAQAFWV